MHGSRLRNLEIHRKVEKVRCRAMGHTRNVNIAYILNFDVLLLHYKILSVILRLQKSCIHLLLNVKHTLILY